MANFDPTPQQNTILSWDNNAVIIAGPGSGKTWTLAKKIQQVIEDCREYQGVIAISYTNKASKELEKRAKLLCGETKQSFFSTIDSFCSSEIVLSFGKRLMGTASGPVLVEKVQDEEQERLIKSIKKAIKAIIEKYSQYPVHQLYDQGICVYEELDLSYRMYLEERFLSGYFDLHLIGGMANLILLSSETCAKYLKAKYRYVFIDEFQDSDFEQFSLFKRLSEIGIMSWAVGDFNQSIYSFKSGSPEYMEQLTTMATFEKFDMNINHRCQPFIQNYADLFLCLQRGMNIYSIPEGDSRIVRVSLTGTQYQIGYWLNESIEKIIEISGVEKKSEIALLGRTNETLEMISDVLTIQHRLQHKLLLNDDRSIGGNMLRQLMILSFNQKEYTAKDFIECYFDYRVRGLRKNIDAVKNLIKEFKLECQNEATDVKKSERVINILSAIIQNIYPDYEISELTKVACDQLINNPTLLENFKPFKEDEIQLLTIHGSKGLEFDVVLHLDLFEDTFPDFRSVGKPVKLREDENLHYIALTRAKEYVFLISNSIKRFYSSNAQRYYEFNKKPSPFISGSIEEYQLTIE
ncbi:DNA helicase-2/ATP-dependent DNA helicase PcrA [Salibacterium salarium]|uniref:UvrD-helicase domain-containing protein n=1 Tax=Salibacterium salarium TaxID=284579 RepID=UPI00278B9566|nr:ATP-dependent helicase [Salibacterium salarium]MDQ0298690.1 DNA helicase-2/ATP-dependent DNA helicase PcrA [Salibacterium salarium]